MDIVFLFGKLCEPYEYFCKNCGQMRLSYVERETKCAGCKSSAIIIGKPNSLNKHALVKEWKKSRKKKKEHNSER